MVPTPIAKRFYLTIPVADWGSEHNYSHPLLVNVAASPVAAKVGTCVVEEVWVVDNGGTAHPELPNVVALVDPAIADGFVRLKPQGNYSAYLALGVTAVSYRVRIYVQLQVAVVFGEMLQDADPTPLGSPMWMYGGGGGGGTPSDTVVSETSFGQIPSAGTDTKYSRGDHTHGTPTDPVPAHAALTSSVHNFDALGRAPPQPHHGDHENGGSDEISVAGLSGVLADPQTPAAHHTSHENGGADEISVAGLSGVLADPQTPAAHALGGVVHTGTLTTGQHGSLSDGDHTGDLSGNARVRVRKAGVSVGVRRAINFIEGTNVQLTIADDPGNEEVDVTIDQLGPTFYREDLSSQIDGIKTTFTLSLPCDPGTLELWMNGLYQGVPPTHYVEVPPNQYTFLDWTPTPGEEMVVRYASTSGGAFYTTNENATFATRVQTDETSYLMVGSMPFHPASFTGKVVRFVAVAAISDVSYPGTIQLYNITDGVPVLTFNVTTTSPARYESAILTLPSATKVYEVRIKSSNSGGRIVLYGSLFEAR